MNSPLKFLFFYLSFILVLNQICYAIITYYLVSLAYFGLKTLNILTNWALILGVMELCTRGLGGSVAQLKSRGVQLSCVRTLVVVAEERPRIALCNSFTALFAPLGLSPRAVSTSFGCRQNIAICLQVTNNLVFITPKDVFIWAVSNASSLINPPRYKML